MPCDSVFILTPLLFDSRTLRRRGGGRYPRFTVTRGPVSYFLSVDEALAAIAGYPSDDREEVYRFGLREVPAGTPVYADEARREWMFSPDGSLIDQTLCSSCHSDLHTPAGRFTGRSADRLRFTVGDIVEWFDGHDSIRLGVVVGLPFSPERCADIMRDVCANPRFSGLENPADAYMLDCSDDCYTILDSPDYMSSHEHVAAHLVFAPAFPVSDRLRRRFADLYSRYISQK